MKKVLAITVALMIAAIILMPALGFTIQAAGNQSYTVKSGERIDYSISTKAPAHNLTPEILVSEYSFKPPAIQSTRMAYTFKTETATPSFKQPTVDNAIVQGMKTKKPVAKLGSVNKVIEAAPLVAAADTQVVTATANNAEATSANETVVASANKTVVASANDTALGNVTASINTTNLN